MDTTSFKLAGDPQPLVLVPTYINEQGPFDFILDTGASTSLITPTLAEKLGIACQDEREALVAGGKIALGLGEVNYFSVGQAKINNLLVGIVDLTDVCQAINAEVMGGIGYNFLQNFDLILNYQKQTLHLTSPIEPSALSTLNLTPNQIKFRLAHPQRPLIVVSTMVNNTGPYQFALDTGASGTVISIDIAEILSLENKAMETVSTGGGYQLSMPITEISSLSVGSTEVENLTVVVADFFAMLSKVAGIKLHGILGFNYLKNFIVKVDYLNEVLTLEPI
ncbi:MAG: aspartyl protease family protein [Acidobacteria bacterium]|nr:aspartyl protease family protein [Acidobacteriota bacterium]